MKLLIIAATFAPSLDGPTYLAENTFADLDEDNARAIVASQKGLYVDAKDDKSRTKSNTAPKERIDAVVAAIKAAQAASKQSDKQPA